MIELLMNDQADHYAVTNTQDVAAGKKPTYPSSPTTPCIPCNYQPNESSVWESTGTLKQRREIRTAKLFLISHKIYKAISIQDQIKVGGVKYHVTGKRPLAKSLVTPEVFVMELSTQYIT
jgi:hypothetical protein